MHLPRGCKAQNKTDTYFISKNQPGVFFTQIIQLKVVLSDRLVLA